MLEDMGKSLDETRYIYCGFPLKVNCLEAGMDALKQSGAEIVLEPDVRAGKITFTAVLEPYFDDEILLEVAYDCGIDDVETIEDAKKALPEEAGMVYAMKAEFPLTDGNGRLHVGGIDVDYCVLDLNRKATNPEEWEVYQDAIDENHAMCLLETFLDAAVEAG